MLRAVSAIDDVFVTTGELGDYLATRISNGDAAITRRSALAATPRSL